MSPSRSSGAWLKRVVEGVTTDTTPCRATCLCFLGSEERLCRYWRHVLRRRSQRRKPNWDRHGSFDRWIPRPRTLHPYPDVRFDARIKGGAVCGNSARTDLCGGR